MQAVILVGGEGTRLRPLTLTRPKPALTLVDRPFIRYMVDWLARHGVDDVVMACGFRPDDLRDALGDGEDGGPRIRYVEEPQPLGTAGPLRHAGDQGLLDERFLALNGDVLTDLDLTALARLHDERQAVATLALYPVEDPSSYGLVRRRPDGEVLGFLEKPDPSQIDTDEISAGAYVLERRVLELVPSGRPCSIEREVFPRLVGQGLYGCRLEGYWMDIGTPQRYLQASWDILEGRVETAAGGRSGGSDGRSGETGVLVEEGAAVDAAAEVAPPVLVRSEAEVGAGASVGGRAVIGCRTVVSGGASVSQSVVLDDCVLAGGATVRDSILAAGVEVGRGARICDGAVVGEGARIAAGVVLDPDARVAPGAQVASGELGAPDAGEAEEVAG